MTKTFRDYGIDVEPGRRGEFDALCPKCSHGRRPEHQRHKCLSVNADKGIWQCHNCGWKGGIPPEKDWRKEYVAPKEYTRPKLIDEGRTEVANTFLAARGISERVADRNEVIATDAQFQFPLRRGGELLTIKTRGIADKTFGLTEKADQIPMGWDDAYGQPVVIIVEGEFDKLAIEEATGWEYVISPPNGSNPSDQVMEYMVDICKLSEKVILAGDMDKVGQEFMDKIAKRIGFAKCFKAVWPEKDANDTLLAHGARRVRECLNDAKAFPVAGIISMDDLSDEVDRLYEDGMPGGDSTGWKSLDRHYTVRRGQMTVLTGSPGSGKSVWLDALLINLARNFDWRLGICSPEFQPLARHEAHLIANYCGKPFGDGPTPRLTVQEKDFAKRWLATRFWFVQPEETTLDAVLERAEVMVKRYGINGFVLDPWNDLEDSRPGNMTETEYIHGALRRIRTFCRNHDVHFWIVAHPTKLRKGTDGKYPPATLYDINGSAGFFNKTDNGLSIYRDYSDDSVPVTLYIQKIKFHEVGGLGSVNFYHDRLTGRYWEAGYE